MIKESTNQLLPIGGYTFRTEVASCRVKCDTQIAKWREPERTETNRTGVRSKRTRSSDDAKSKGGHGAGNGGNGGCAQVRKSRHVPAFSTEG